MIFLLMVGSAFIYGAMKGYRQWKSQGVVVNQRSNGWRN